MSLPFSSERIVHFKTAEEYTAQIEVQKQEDLFVLYERFIGTYADLEKNWYQFLDKYKDFWMKRRFWLSGFLMTLLLPARCNVSAIFAWLWNRIVG